MTQAFVSVIIVNYNGADVIIDCLSSIFAQLPATGIEVIVVDNASIDGSPDLIAQTFPQVTLLRQTQNLGFGAANNIGVKQARGDYVFLLNSDTLLPEQPKEILLTLITKFTQSPDVGIIGPKLFNPDNSFQLSTAYEIGLWGEFRTLRDVRTYRQLQNRPALAARYRADQCVDIVVGAAMFMSRSLYKKVGGFDETFFMYFEESDLCQRVRNLGYKILYTPDVSVIHIGGYSVAQSADKMAEAYRRSQRFYYQKHRPQWEQWILNRYLAFKKWRQSTCQSDHW